MNDPAHQVEEIDLLEILLTLIESLPVLVAGFVLAGLVAFGLATMQPSSHQSNAILHLAEADDISPSLIKSPDMIRAALALGDTDLSVDRIIDGLTIGPRINADEIEVSLTLVDSADARSVLAAVLAVFEGRIVAPHLTTQREALRRKLAAAETQIEEYDKAIARLAKALVRIESEDPFQGPAFADIYSALLQAQSERQAQLEMREAYIADISAIPASLIVSTPSIPQPLGGRGPLQIALLAGFTAGLLILVVILFGRWLNRSSTNPAQAKKIARIRRAFFLKPRSRV